MTSLPGAVRRAVEAALEAAAGRTVRVTAWGAVGGGCVNPAARLDTDGGEAFFVKWNQAAPRGMFQAEAEGLGALRAAGGPAGLRVPEVRGVGEGGEGEPSWLLMELVARGAAGGAYGRTLGRGLAGMHGSGSPRPAAYGWERDNFIGPLPQENPATDDWASFWRDARLAPQLARARAGGHFRGGDGRLMERALERVEDALAGAESDGVSLLHGDLWSGNVYPGPEGEPVLVDPAVYRGHREVDLAMSELFGGFPPGYLEAYHEHWPVDERYRRVRRALYQLYYLLVHVNLFGGGYVAGSLQAARSVLAGA